MKTVLKILAAVVALLVVVAIVAYAWATVVSNRALSQTIETHAVGFPIPFPLAPDEVAELDLTEQDSGQLALDRAAERGRHLVMARYGCVECHGPTFGGGVMVDAFPLGTFLGPNLTFGEGTRTADYRPADWDRIVRHGVLPDGRPAVMPSEDFQLMSDQEPSDIVVFIRTMPPVDNAVPPSSLGPLGKFLVATGNLTPSATMIASHTAAHPERPPAAEASTEFGRHLAGVCIGCHGSDLSGGPIPGGDPAWPPARNLTPDPSALGGWTFDQFVTALRESRRPDETALREPMTVLADYANNMTDIELRAMWAYLQSIPPVPVTDQE